MEKDKDIIEIIVDEKQDFSNTIIQDNDTVADDISSQKQNFKIFHKFNINLSPLFVKISCAIGVIVILISAVVGVAIPKSETSINKQLANIRSTDKTYLSAKSDYDALSQELNRLQADLAQKEKSFQDFSSSQEGLDKIMQENDTLKKEQEQLTKEVDKKENTLNSLTDATEKSTKATVTLASGTYKVGENISPGNFNVMGTGSIAISASGKSRVNDTLKSDGKSYTLNDGEIIKISGKAQFIPE